MTHTKFTSDIDIDLADRNRLLSLIEHVPATIIRSDGTVAKHNTGVYVTKVPVNPFTGTCSFDYKQAEDLGYVKLDFLNVNVYSEVKDPDHLTELLSQDPDWGLLEDKRFFEKVIHIGNHYDTFKKMPEPVNSIERMAMFLAIIRPAKRHLIGKTWKEVAKTIWLPDESGVYSFKKSHSVSYAHLVVVHMNLLAKSFSLE